MMNHTRPLASRMRWEESLSGVQCRISISLLGGIHFRYIPVVWHASIPHVPVTGFRVDIDYAPYYAGLHKGSLWKV